MRMKVTPCGSNSKGVDAAAEDVIDYLLGKKGGRDRDVAKLLHGPEIDGQVTYYADSVEGPGRWRGSGAAFFGLSGEVERAELFNLLTGRHPTTGARLVTAKGSAGRSDLRTGTFTSFDEHGHPVYSPRDAAAALRRPLTDIEHLFVYHANVVASTASDDQPDAIHIAVDADNNQWISETELRRVEATLVDDTAIADRIRRAGVGSDVLTVAQAAELVGVGATYIRRQRRYYAEHAAEIEQTLDETGEYPKAFIRATRRPLEPTGTVTNRVWPESETLTVSQAAEIAGVTARSVQRWIAQGDVAALNRSLDRIDRLNGRGFEIDTTEFRAFIETRDAQTSKRPKQRDWEITREELAGFVERRKRPAVRVGYDLTVTSEKSVSVLAMLAEGHIRDTMVQALESANDVGIGYIERTAAWTRKQTTIETAGGEKYVEVSHVGTEGLTVASFLHGTSRDLDPFLHFHNVVANSTVDANGEAKTLDATQFYTHAPAAAALASARMRYELTGRLGIRWIQAPSGAWEIDGVPPESLRVFSKRSAEIADAVAELLDPATAADRDAAALATRKEKVPTTRAELVGGWRDQATETGLTAEAIASCFGQDHTVHERLDHDMQIRLQAWLVGPDGVCQSKTVFTRVELIQQISRWWTPRPDGQRQLVVIAPEEIERQADLFLASSQCVELDLTAERSGEGIRRKDGTVVSTIGLPPTFTTLTALRRQRRVLAWMRDTTPTNVGVCSTIQIEQAILASTMTSEQADMVRQFCGTPRQAMWAIGVAGAGKTYSLQYARQAWEQAGWAVRGSAVSAKACEALSESIPADTLERLLTQWEESGNNPLDARTVFVVDEAGTLSDVDMARTIRMVQDAGAVLRLVGDPAQHSSVNAGGLYQTLCKSDATVRLMTARRVRHAHDRRAAELLRGDASHDARQALDELAAGGHLVVAETERDAYLAALRRWWEHETAGRPHPMIEDSNAVRVELAAAAQRLRQHAGYVSTDTIAGGQGRTFGIGDRVIARINDKTLTGADSTNRHVINGSTGTVTHLDHATGTITVDFDGLGTIEMPRTYYADREHETGFGTRVGLELAYAVTSHGVQGATLEDSTAIFRPNTTQAAAYVNLTRGKHSNVAIVTGTPAGELEALPDGTEPDIVTDIVRALSAPKTEPALSLDPDAIIANHAANTRTTIELAADATDPNRPKAEQRLLQRALRTELDAIRRCALHHIDQDVIDIVGPRPDIPHLARQWETIIEDIAVYDSLHPRAEHTTPRWDPANHRHGHVEAATIVDAIVDLRVARAERAIAAIPERPDEAALATLDTLRDTAVEPADAANTAVFEASKTFDRAHIRYRRLAERKQTLTNRITEIEQLPMRKRGRHRAELAGHQQELTELQPEIDTATVERAEAFRSLEDAEHRAANARNGLPTSEPIAARETFLRRATCRNLPHWAKTHLDKTCRQDGDIDVDRLATLYARAAAYRERWQIHPEETSLLGLAPENASAWQQREWETITGRTPHHGRTATYRPTQTAAPTPR